MKRKQSTTSKVSPALKPKLRFPEFRSEPDWEPKRLGQALKFQPGFPFPSAGFNDVGKGLRLIRNRDLRSKDNVVFYSGDFDASFIVHDGDVLVGMDGDFSPTIWKGGKSLLNQRVGRVLPRENNEQQFLLYLLELCLKGIEQATARTTVKHLSHSAVEDKHEPLPEPGEQKKIAHCLSTLDALIGAESQKLDALKTHKKGLMQQLFPREGETLPGLRFREFQDAPEWEEAKLGDLVEIRSGRSPSQYRLSAMGMYAFVKVEDLNNCTKYQTIAREYSDDADGLIPPGSVLFPKRGAAIALNKVRQNIQPVLADTNMMALTPLDQLNVEFLYQYLSLVGLSEIADNSTIPQINNKHIIPFEVAIPGADEQQRIASCLSSLDDLIAAQSDQLDALKTHKKGLMQQLFPSPSPVEAEG